MATIYSNRNSSKSALTASQYAKTFQYEKCLSFENSQKEMKDAIIRDLNCVKKIKW